MESMMFVMLLSQQELDVKEALSARQRYETYQFRLLRLDKSGWEATKEFASEHCLDCGQKLEGTVPVDGHMN
jgi:hypothetical protein